MSEQTERFDLRTVAEGAAAAWDDAPEFLKPILRDCSDALLQAAEETDAVPQWRKRPTQPGLYVCYPGLNMSVEMLVCVFLGEEEIKAGAPHAAELCYGPIEKPKE